ncbi:hypothetical protein [Falsirhodobacter sp. 1013]|uniref:hypothetical protein n=1 Tax=Falsirhodobacter sp. 1013 TaxID=3417566 RepID=UPI003EB73ADD
MASRATGLAVPNARLPGLDGRRALGVWAAPGPVALVLRRAYARDAVTPVLWAARSEPLLWRQPLAGSITLFFAAHSLVFYSVVNWYATCGLARGVPAATAGYHLLVYKEVAKLAPGRF